MECYLIVFPQGRYKSVYVFVGCVCVFVCMYDDIWGVENVKIKVLSNRLGIVRVWRYKNIPEW